MSRKSKKPKARGGHLKAVPSLPKLPLQLVLSHRSIDSLATDFVRWFERIGDARGALHCLEVVKLFMTTSHAVSEESSATRLNPDILEEAALAIAGVLGEADMDQAIDELYEDLHLYVDFLHETGRWSGSEEEYSRVVSLLVEDDDFPDIPPVELPDLNAEEQDRAFQELRIDELAGKLLEWIGDGKAVTSTGVLRLNDIEGAAAAVGVKAKGTKNPKRGLVPSLGLEASGHGENTSLEVASMHDVPVLREIWAALADAGLLRLTATRAMPGPGAGTWNSPDVDPRLAIRRGFLTAFLARSVLNSGGPGHRGPQVNALFAATLFRGGTADPLSVEELDNAARPGSGEDFHLLFSATRARSELAALADLGLITVDTHYRVAPVAIQCVLPALAVVMASEEGPGSEDLDGGDPLGFGPAEVPAAGLRPAAPAFQLKIQLKGSKPPIWRRVLVPGNIRLRELHHVIQAVFDWLDYHLHVFEVGGWRGTKYGPKDSPDFVDFGDEGMRDESRVQLQELLSEPGDSMEYAYDFGDNWEHSITLEKVLDSGEGQPLPRCTGGRGLAPAEDSGGVWGWSLKVAAANDPADPDHKEMREWLGLAPGEVLDPKAFDLEDADAALKGLR